MSQQEQVRECVFDAISTFNEDGGAQIEKSMTAPLLGPESALDSLSFVRFIVVLEQRIEDTFGQAISLTDEKAMSQRNSPFRSVGTAADYVLAELTGSVQ